MTLEEKYTMAYGLLEQLDSYFDFSEPFVNGDEFGFKDASGVNAVCAKVIEFLRNE